MNWLVCALFAGLLFTALLLEGAPRAEAAMLGLFGGIFTYRWFSRSFAFVDNRMAAAIRSDLVYSMALVAGLGALAFTRHMDFTSASKMLLAAALLALFPFGAGFFKTQIAALGGNPLRYWPIFRDLTRWSLLGVTLTEITVNAHAYLVTFVSGPGAFALLALGMLLFRPASLMQSALPDMERPVMARAMAAKDIAMVGRVQRHFGQGLVAAWGINLLLSTGLLAFFPILVLKKGYALDEVILVAGLSAIIMALRAWRMPLAVLLQAAGRFKDLAGIATISGAVSVAATLILLLTFGPIASLIGIVLGELVMLVHVRRMAKAWWAEHA